MLARLLLPFALVLTAFAQQPASLEQAHQRFDSGDYQGAAELYRSVVASQPDNAKALAGLVDSMEALGEWRAALPSLERLNQLEPGNALRTNQLGRWRSWNGDSRGLDDLSRACAMDKTNPRYCTDYAIALSWQPEKRNRAITLLRSVVAEAPQYVPALQRLAELLSWRTATRPEAARLFEEGVRLAPQNVEMLVSYAELLTYDRATQQRALALYDQALTIEPSNARALTGKAQLLAITGHSSEALVIYDRVLASDPDNIAALRGKAEIMNWRGNYREAYDLLQHARNSGSDDPRISAEMARAQLGLQHNSDAQRIVSGLPDDPDFTNVRGQAARATGWYVEGGVAFRRNASNLEYDQATAAISAPVGSQNRLTFRYTPTLYQDGNDFNSNYYGAALDSRIGDSMTLRTTAAAITYPGFPTEYIGRAQARIRINSALDLGMGFDRSPVDESELSLRGVQGLNGLMGQVTSNLANIGVSLRNRRHGFDGSVVYTDGLYLGSGLEPNRRWAVEGNFGKSIHDVPYLRVAYGFAYAQFDYDADADAAPPNQTGGYYSPTQYLLNYLGLTISQKFGQRFEFDVTGTAGAQNAETTTSQFGDPEFAGNFSAGMLWRPTERDELRVRYEYLNVFNAFHRHLPSVSWRHYF